MSTITREFTKEQLIEKLQHRIAVAAKYPDLEEAQLDAAIFKIALASLEAKPIGAFHISDQQVGGTTDYIKDGEWPIDDGVIEVYAAPPAPVSVPDAMDDQGGVCCEVSYADGWNACRDAMLQGADGNSPVIPDGWVMLPAEPTQAMMNAWLSEVANWRGHAAGYRAMIAAAPRQEAE